MLAMLIFLATLAKATSAPLPAKGPWIVDGEEDLCVLERNYADEKGTSTLAFKPLLDLDTIELYVVTDDKSSAQHSGNATVKISPGDRTYISAYFSVVKPDKHLRYTRLSIDRAILSEMKDGDILSVAAKPIATSFPIVRPEKAVAFLQQCIDSLEKSWGVDPASKTAIATEPQGNPARFFNASNYPPDAYRDGVYGRVIALLNIDASGAVEHCRIVSSAGKTLNEGTCKAALRIKFKPARDKNNVPVASTYLLPVRWVLP